MMVSKLEEELVGVSCIKPQKKTEDRQDYLIRLMKKVASIPDPEWNDLSQEAKDWNDEAAKSYNEGTDIIDFTDYDEVEEPEPVEEEEVEDEKVIEFEAEYELSDELVVKEPKPPKTEIRGKGKMTACNQVELMVIRKPWVTATEIIEELGRQGVKVTPVTVSTLRSTVRRLLRLLNHEGLGNFQMVSDKDANS